MLLVIDDRCVIGDFQDKFNECYPFLKIEFYDIRHKCKQASSDEHRLNSKMRLSDIRKNHNSDIFEIRSSFKTGKLEQDFRHLFSLYIQVFYLMNGVWIQSVAADDLTLGQLMEIINKAKTPRSNKGCGS